MRGYALVPCALLVFLACGGGGKKTTNKPSNDTEVKAAKPETDADREKKRLAKAHEIVPEGSSCLPATLKDDNAPRLELGAAGKEALVCAIDQDRSRLLGTVACWKLDVTSGKLEYKDSAALPGRGVTVMLDGKSPSGDHPGSCARGYCLPNAPKTKVVSMAKNLDGSKVAVLADDDVHLFNGASKAHESSFTIRGDKGVTNEPKAVHFVAESILVEGADEGPYAAVWVFKTDGTQVGPIKSLGGKEEKPVSMYHGSFSILDKTRVAIAEKGMELLTIYDVNTGARAKLVRKLPKLACKPAELDAYWVDGDKVSDKCKDSIKKASGHLEGGTVVAGGKSHVILLRGARLGEIAIVDQKSLAEKSVLKMPWCGGGDDAAGGGAAKEAASPAPKDAPKETAKVSQDKKKGARSMTQSDSSDPQEGGE